MPTLLKGFAYKKSLGSGHFGEVYLAEADLTGEVRAIKHIHASRHEMPPERWAAEAKAMSECDSDHLVRIVHSEVTDEGPVLVMEYLPGGTAEQRWHDSGGPVAEVLQLLIEVCWGLQNLHDKGLVHRDIKPANILFDEHGKAVLGDFGLADTSGVRSMFNYRPHSPPEVLKLQPWTKSADIFALGVTALRLLAGDDTCGYSDYQLRARTWSWPDPDNLELPLHIHKRLKSALRKMLHPDPAKRPATAHEARDLLGKAIPAISFRQVGRSEWSGTEGSASWTVLVSESADGHEVRTSRDLGAGVRKVARGTFNFAERDQAYAAAQGILNQLCCDGRLASE